MRTYTIPKIHIKSTTLHRLKWTLILGSVSLTLTLGSLECSTGQEQACAPIAYQKIQSTCASESAIEIPVVLGNNNAEELIAKTIYGEARGCSTEEQELVAWCILNRVEDGTWGDTVEDVVTYPNAFHGYCATNPATEEHIAVATKVLNQWHAGESAPVRPPYSTTSNYTYMSGKNGHNYFREEW